MLVVVPGCGPSFTRFFRFQRVTPGAKPLCTTQSASPDWLKRHLEHADETRSAPSHMRSCSVSCTSERREVARAENRRQFEVWPVLPDFVGTLEATGRGSAPHVRCGSHSPKLRLCQS